MRANGRETVPAYRAGLTVPPACESSSNRAVNAYRRGVVAAVLLYLLVAFASPGVHAQTDPTAQLVPPDWSLIPDINGDDVPDILTGQSFRLLFVTTETTAATSAEIGTYNAIVQRNAAAGHSDIQDFSTEFRALISTGSAASVDARDNTATNHEDASPLDPDVPIYWLNGAKIADNYADFYDNSWDSLVPRGFIPRNQDGNTFADGVFLFVWHGSEFDGTERFIGSGDSFAAGMTRVARSRYIPGSPGADPPGFGGGEATSITTSLDHLFALSPICTPPGEG